MDPNTPNNHNNQTSLTPASAPESNPTPSPAPTSTPEPVSNPVSTSEPASEPSPAPAPAPEAEATPTPAPAPEPAPAPDTKPPKKSKLKPGLAALIVFIFFLLGIGGTFVGLVAGGVIKLGSFGNSINVFSNNPTVPSVEKIQSVCADYNGTFKQQDNQQIDSNSSIYATPYLCEGSDGYIFSTMIFSKNLLDIMGTWKERYADQISSSEEAQQIDLDSVSTFVKFLILTDSMEMTDIENSPNYYKATLENKPSSDDQPSMTWYQKAYVVAYDNVVISSMINDDASSEAILTALGANK